MKKFLSVLSLIALLGLAAPANAAPPPPPGGGHGPRGGMIVTAGPGMSHRRPPGGPQFAPPPPRHSNAGVVVGGVLARRSYWGYPYGCDYRLSWYDGFYYQDCRPLRPYYGGIYIRF